MKKILKNEIGITLISLIITIIVLLILAGASISMLTGYDSIPDNAKTAVDASRQDATDEQNMIDKIGGLFEKYLTGVYGNLYKISDTEYHLIFNSTGAIAQGYTEEQLEVRGTNIFTGGNQIKISEGVYETNLAWEPYLANITKVKIEEKIKPISTSYYFFGLTEITEIEGIENLDTSNVTNMRQMFYNCKKLIRLEVSGFKTSNVTNMNRMFYGCESLTELNVSGFDTRNVTDMNIMFYGCKNVTNLDIGNWNTSNVTNMNGMFSNCNKLTSVDVSKWDTNNVTDMRAMFGNCHSLINLDVSGLDTKNVDDMYEMFYNCYNLVSINVSGWDTSNVTDMGRMYMYCKSLTVLDISSFNTQKVEKMNQMFYTCITTNKIYVGNNWSTNNVTESSQMFFSCNALSGVITYDKNKVDATYANWETGYLTYKANVDENGLARENITIKPSADSNLQIVIPKGMAPAILAGSGTTTSLPGQDGSVASIMPATEWNKITTEQIDKGIVIVDHAITYTGTVPDFNEFVWVPIPESSDFDREAWTTRYGYDANGSWGDGGETGRKHLLAEETTINKFWEDKTTTGYTNMVSSVNQHKGFYIARYEASLNGTIAQSKRGQEAKVSISQIDSITACTSNTSIPNMHLMYGIEWDSTLKWLNGNATIASSTTGAFGTEGTTKTMELADIQTNSNTWGNYSNSIGNATNTPYVKDTKQNTGASEYWKANNIYDLAGNVYEWTQEQHSTGDSRTRRGGSYDNNGGSSPAAYRTNLTVNYTSIANGFRASFYL